LRMLERPDSGPLHAHRLAAIAAASPALKRRLPSPRV
jgi:hypothetical protein